MQVIAIVTDRLTDGAVIKDLHNAASRGVPVYIILNQRSIQENFMLNRLRQPVSHLPTNQHTPRRMYDMSMDKPPSSNLLKKTGTKPLESKVITCTRQGNTFFFFLLKSVLSFFKFSPFVFSFTSSTFF